mgnify:CR=1 FL=1
MNKGIIELNDAAIRIGINGEHVHTSVGYAVLDQQHLMVGTEAQQKAKLFPRWTNPVSYTHLTQPPTPTV